MNNDTISVYMQNDEALVEIKGLNCDEKIFRITRLKTGIGHRYSFIITDIASGNAIDAKEGFYIPNTEGFPDAYIAILVTNNVPKLCIRLCSYGEVKE